MPIEALLALATSTLTYLTVHEKNNPTWLKELKKLNKLKREWHEEYNKGAGNRNQYKLDKLTFELCEFQIPIVDAFNRLSTGN